MAIWAVRSNCRPAVHEKSASSTTFAHGPGHDAGGVKVNGLGEKSANWTLEKSCTAQGVVCGRGTGGSAVAVLDEPTTWARPGAARLRLMASTRRTCRRTSRESWFMVMLLSEKDSRSCIP